jgi:Protein of unknown function (DUF2950)
MRQIRAGTVGRIRILQVVLAAVLLAASMPGGAAETPQRTFPSPEQAVEALVAASRDVRTRPLLEILGPEGRPLVRSGDRIADRRGRARFVAAFDEFHAIEMAGEDRATLVVGPRRWPWPIPLVREGGAWRFDTRAGAQEILDRRIGHNELSVIEVCRAYVMAQRDYAAADPLSTGRHAFAQRFASTAGVRDGLYWPAKPGEGESPLGPLVARARAEGYGGATTRDKPQPYHGYFYRILTRQGAHAPGGPASYVADGHMTGGFALLAFPAKYGQSGAMTFIVNQAGIVYQKNLGPDTTAIARAMTEYDPDPTWTIVD